jgi:hypothetical protein
VPDVVVYGATAGGVVAAVAAAREGASVALVGPGRHVGGMLSGGLSRSDVERQETLIGGLAAEVFARIGDRYGGGPGWRFEPHVAEEVLLELLGEAGVDLVLDLSIDAVAVERRRVSTLTAPDGRSVDAAVWIDASYEGDLFAAAGASSNVGREDRELNGERLAGRREILPNPHQARAPVSALDDDGHLLPFVVPYDELPSLGSGDGKVQSYCYRICLSRADDRLPLDPPLGYDRARYVLVERYLAALAADGIRPSMHDVIGISELPNGKVDVNSHGPFSTNLLGAAWSYPEASADERLQIAANHESWARGLLHFLSTDAVVPGEISDLLSPYGYPADEFADNDHWPHQLYVREARRLVGEHVLTERDVFEGRMPADTIALGGYNIDIREVQWVACPISRFPDVHHEVLVEGYLSVPVEPYGIPYRSLLPLRTEVENLLVSTCVSASAVAFASLRMEPQFLVMGHAAGVAAAFAARRNTAVHDVDPDEIRGRLEASGQVIRRYAGAGGNCEFRPPAKARRYR